MKALVLTTFGLLACVLAAAAQAAEKLPAWFEPDPARLDKIFDAWRALSTREAALYLCQTTDVVAGILRNARGEPMPLTPLEISSGSLRRRKIASLRTDEHGYFIIYGPYRSRLPRPEDPSEDMPAFDSPEFFTISAIPGFPFLNAGYQYAREKQAIVPCDSTLITNYAGSAFYALTCDGTNRFDAADFEAFKTNLLAKQKSETIQIPKPQLWARTGPTEGHERTQYTLRLLSPDGAPIAGARVGYEAYDGYSQNGQTVETDTNGVCVVEEYLYAGKSAEYYAQVKRSISVDAAVYGEGPLDAPLEKGRTNTLVLPRPASIRGTVQQANGLGADTVELVYDGFGVSGFPRWSRVLVDGSYSFDRIMPGRSFAVRTLSLGPDATSARSESMVLKPGEQRTDVNLKAPLASGLWIMLIDQRGDPVTTVWDGRLDATNSYAAACEGGPVFCFGLLRPEVYRVALKAKGFVDYGSEPIRLEPGELRAIKIVLKDNPKRFGTFPLRERLKDLGRYNEDAEWATNAVRQMGTNALPDLLTLLQSTNKDEQTMAVHGFEALGPLAKTASAELTRRLETDQTALTTHALVAIGDPQPFLERLKSPNLKVRQHATWAMGQMQEERAVPGLIEALHDEDVVVRDHAIWALGQIGKEPAIVMPLIAGFLTNSLATHRSSAAYALGSFGREAGQFAPEVEKLLHDSDYYARSYASNALERIRRVTN